MNIVETKAYHRLLTGYLSQEFPVNIQNVFTPFKLCGDIIRAIGNQTNLYDKDYLVFNFEFVELLIEKGIIRNRIYFATDCIDKALLAKHDRYAGINIDSFDSTKEISSMTLFGGKKFDVVLMNPPYQRKSEIENSPSQPIWQLFIQKVFLSLKEGGYLGAIHPSGWRDVDGKFKNTQNLLKSKKIIYLEMHDENDGMKTFSAITPYDWYILENVENNSLTKIVGQNGEDIELDLSKIDFIPNGMFSEIDKLLAKGEEEKVNIIHDCSYHKQARTKDKTMINEKTEEFCYPCIFNIRVDDLNLLWTKDNTRGHFNIPKVIFNSSANGGTSIFVDSKGEYGMCQFCSGIVDKEENLANIKKALDSEKFLSIMKFNKTGTALLNHRIIALFRKDFWRDFV